MNKLIATALVAGLAGGMAEITWITLYGYAASASPVEVARQVAATVVTPATEAPWMAWAGVAIHIGLSLTLALAFVLMVHASGLRLSTRTVWIASLLALGSVWAVNFFVVLPILNPAFAVLLPHSVTLASKILFGAAMAGVLSSLPTPSARAAAGTAGSGRPAA